MSTSPYKVLEFDVVVGSKYHAIPQSNSSITISTLELPGGGDLKLRLTWTNVKNVREGPTRADFSNSGISFYSHPYSTESVLCYDLLMNGNNRNPLLMVFLEGFNSNDWKFLNNQWFPFVPVRTSRSLPPMIFPQLKSLEPFPFLGTLNRGSGLQLPTELPIHLSINCGKYSTVQNQNQNPLDVLVSLLLSCEFSHCNIITTDGCSHKCFKAILFKNSEIIRRAFEMTEGQTMEEAKMNQFKINCSSDIFRVLLLYFYKGELPVLDEDSAIELFRVAHMYQIELLQTNLAKMILVKANDWIDVDNVLIYAEFAEKYDLDELKEFILAFIDANTSAVMKLPDWKKFRSAHGDLVDKLILNKETRKQKGETPAQTPVRL